MLSDPIPNKQRLPFDHFVFHRIHIATQRKNASVSSVLLLHRIQVIVAHERHLRTVLASVRADKPVTEGRTSTHAHKSFSLSMNQVNGEHVAWNIEGVALVTQVIDVLHLVAAVVDESLVEKEGVLIVPQHDIATMEKLKKRYGSWKREGKHRMCSNCSGGEFIHTVLT